MEVVNTTQATLSKEELLKKLRSHQFARFDLSLFLNTHPHDKRALQMHAELSKKANELREEYVKMYGPLTSADCVSTENWCWNDDPWPWEAQ